jgi:hypothetical protein
MKYLTQVVAPILIVVGIIGGITFVVQYSGLGKPAPNRPDPGTVSADDLLHFSQRKAQWGDDDPDYAAEFEVGARHDYDFRFENRTPSPVTLSLESKTCACSEISVATLPPGTASSVPPAAHDVWQRLEPKATSLTVPAANESGPAVGWVRLSWQGRKEGPERLNAILRVEQGLRGRQTITLSAVVIFVPPILVESDTVKLKDLASPGQEETVEFNCWSATRAQFPLTVREAKASGNVVHETRPLTEVECRALATATRARVKAGYRVRVTVRERRDGAVLDLGPFQYKLVLAGPPDRPPAEVTLTGVVRGEVAVASAEDAAGIQLRTFPAEKGTEKTIGIVSDRGNMNLRLEAWTPEAIEVRLGPGKMIDGRQRWELFVKVPPRAVVGALPEDSAVILRVEGDTPRRMRLPVHGQGIQ